MHKGNESVRLKRPQSRRIQKSAQWTLKAQVPKSWAIPLRNLANEKRPRISAWWAIGSANFKVHIYWLDDWESWYEELVAKHVYELLFRLQARIEAKISDLMYLLSSWGSLHSLKMACDDNRIHNGAAKWLFQCYMRFEPAAKSTARSSLKSKSFHFSIKDRVVKQYCQVVSWPSKMCAPQTRSSQRRTTRLLGLWKLRLCRRWNLPMILGSNHLEIHTFTTNMSSRKSSLADFGST